MLACPNDDTGNCCGGKCLLNPIVVMATYNRVAITSKNIDSLLNQNCKIVLVVSDVKESELYKLSYPEIVVTSKPNNPLGAKWQHGVDIAREMNPNPLIICGSDDILSKDFIDNACKLILVGWDIVGLTEWYTYDEINNRLYKMMYKGPNEFTPIGSGKCISPSMLEKMKYKLFDTNVSRHLDDVSFAKSKIHAAKVYLNGSLKVLAVKGDWRSMNPINNYLYGKNIRYEEISLTELKHFEYVPDQRNH